MENNLVKEKSETYFVWDESKIRVGDTVVVDVNRFAKKLSHLDSNKLKAIGKSLSFKPHKYTHVGHVIDIRARGKELIVAVPKSKYSNSEFRFHDFGFCADKDADKVEVILHNPRSE